MPSDTRTAAAIPSRQSPEVAVETADDGTETVHISGTALHDGLNQNAWGLTEQGARTIADSLVGCDLTAGHPPLRQAGDRARYDRSIHNGQGETIGEVAQTEVVTADQAMLAGGEYTVEYMAEVRHPDYATKYRNELLTGDDYGVSVGIYGNPDAAECSACGDAMGECDHERFEEVESNSDSDSDTADDSDGPQIAGPLYDDGESDHLAAVFLPAYNDADVGVASTVGGAADSQQGVTMAAHAASFGTRPGTGPRDTDTATGTEADTATEQASGARDLSVFVSETPVYSETAGSDDPETTVRF